jgi:hypothetical protein
VAYDNPAEAEALKQAKCDGPFLWKVLGVTKNGNHEVCPLCKKRNMSVYRHEQTGEYGWGCKSGCGKGTVVDAIMLVERKDTKTALNEAKAPYRSAQSPHSRFAHGPVNLQASNEPSEVRFGTARPEPKLDKQRATEYVEKHHQYLMDHLDDVLNMCHRGISVEVIEEYKLGFVEDEDVQWVPWHKPSRIPAAWVIPVTDEKEELRAVKVHFESRPVGYDGKPWNAKALWLPFGTEPTYDEAVDRKPHHAFYTLWPHPETLVRPLPEVTVDVNWWVSRIPQGHPLQQRLETAREQNKLCMAMDRKVSVGDLSDADCGQALDEAFASMRAEIVRLVTKGEKAEPEKAEEGSENPDWSEYIFVTPGELKAMALRTMGLMATAMTSGESWIPPLDVLSRCFAGCKVVIFMDEDAWALNTRGEVYSPGIEYAQRLNAAIMQAGAAEIIVMSGGHRRVTT